MHLKKNDLYDHLSRSMTMFFLFTSNRIGAKGKRFQIQNVPFVKGN